MELFNIAVTALGFLYGFILVHAAFFDNSITSKFRIDTLFIANPTTSTRMLNLILGLFIIGYNGYALFKSMP